MTTPTRADLEATIAEQAAEIERLREAVSKFLRDNNPEGFGCACEPNRLCGPCSEAKRQRPLYEALSIPSSANAPRTACKGQSCLS